MLFSVGPEVPDVAHVALWRGLGRGLAVVALAAGVLCTK